MANYNNSTRNRVGDINHGLKVDRAAALITAASVPLFTIAGGRVAIHEIFGEIMVQIAATATLIHIDVEPTAGGAVPLCIDSADIQGHIVGQLYSVPAAVGSAMTVAAGGAYVKTMPTVISGVGTINLHASAAPATGTVKWTVVYVPIDEGAYIEAA